MKTQPQMSFSIMNPVNLMTTQFQENLAHLVLLGLFIKVTNSHFPGSHFVLFGLVLFCFSRLESHCVSSNSCLLPCLAKSLGACYSTQLDFFFFMKWLLKINILIVNLCAEVYHLTKLKISCFGTRCNFHEL